jgi:hypothetical protein
MPGENFSLKPGYAFLKVNGEWEIEVADEEALKTAVPSGECVIDDAKCVGFVDAQKRSWAQTKVMARNKP